MVSESKIHLLFIFAFFFLLQIHISAGQNAVKAAYWSADSGFAVSSIDSSLFTHLFCAFADLDPQTNRVIVSSTNQASFSTFTQTVQQKNPSVKTLLSIGGGNSSPDAFALMVSQSSSRKSFIDSSISLARSYGFHGLDLDWEYPNTTTKMSNLGLLLNEWRAAVASESTASDNPPLLLSAAVFRNKDYYTIDYPIQAISNSLDWINVMAYDFYGPAPDWSPTSTGPPAALYNPGTQISGDYGITSWIQAGVPSTKIVLGFPFYGWAWRLLDANSHGLFAPANGSALPGEGSIGYGQIKTFITQNRATTVYNATVVSDYCYSGTTWIGYDDTQSISAKVSYAKGKNLLGYFAWHAGADDNWTLSKQALSTWEA